MTTLLVGIGSPILCDDGVGLHVLQRLRARGLPEGVEAVELGTGGLALMDLLEGYERAVIVDAIVTGAPPGTIHLLSGNDMARAAHLGPGHDVDLPTALEIAAGVLGRQMPAVVVVAIEAADLCTFSETLSEKVEAALDEAVERVWKILSQPQP